MTGSPKVSGLPIKARLYRRDSWQVKRKGQGESFIVSRTRLGQWESVNVWAAREDFLAVKTAEDALRFFRLYGPFDLEEADSNTVTASTEVSLSTVKQFQRWSQHFINQPSPNWCSGERIDMRSPDGADRFARNLVLGYKSPPFTLEMGHVITRSGKVPSPFLEFKAFDVRSAVYGSIYLDKMRGLRGGVCQREGCTNTFLTLDPRKRYCDGPGDCGAVSRMRNKRAAARLEH